MMNLKSQITQNLILINVKTKSHCKNIFFRVFLNTFQKLGQLFLSDNSFESFCWNANNERAKYVKLDENHVTNLKIVSSHHYPSRTKFSLRNNSLATLELDLANLHVNDSYTFCFDNNPFDCDINLHNLFVTPERNPQVHLDFERANCSQPRSMKGRYLNDLSRRDLRCNIVDFFSICSCFYEEDQKVLNIDCVNHAIKSPPDFDKDDITSKTNLSYDRIRFNIALNQLKSLPDISRKLSLNIVEIVAANNSIEYVGLASLNSRLRVLDLRNNKLKYLSHDVIRSLAKLDQVMLSGNPWVCDCTDLFVDLKSIQHVVKDYGEVYCSNLGKRFADLSNREVCFDWSPVAACGIVLGVFGFALSLFYKFKKSIKIFLYAHDMCLWFVNEEELDEDKNYDAFVCFALPDQRLVYDIITELEGDQFSCLVGTRDWPPGHTLPELVIYFVCFIL